MPRVKLGLSTGTTLLCSYYSAVGRGCPKRTTTCFDVLRRASTVIQYCTVYGSVVYVGVSEWYCFILLYGYYTVRRTEEFYIVLNCTGSPAVLYLVSQKYWIVAVDD